MGELLRWIPITIFDQAGMVLPACLNELGVGD